MSQLTVQNTLAANVKTPPSGYSSIYSKYQELWSKDSDGNHTLIGPNGATTITYADLAAAVANSELSPGKHYIISDFVTSHEIAFTSDVNSGSTEPLIVMAVTAGSLSKHALSTVYPYDLLLYNIDNTDFPGSATGWIEYREDTSTGVSAHYDWRVVKSRRWKVDLTPYNLTDDYWCPYPTGIDIEIPIAGTGPAYSTPTQTPVNIPVSNINDYVDYLTFNNMTYNPYGVRIGKYTMSLALAAGTPLAHYPFIVFDNVLVQNFTLAEQCYGFTLRGGNATTSNISEASGNFFGSTMKNVTANLKNVMSADELSNVKAYKLENFVSLDSTTDSIFGEATCFMGHIKDSQFTNITNTYAESGVIKCDFYFMSSVSAYSEFSNNDFSQIDSSWFADQATNSTFNNISSATAVGAFNNNQLLDITNSNLLGSFTYNRMSSVNLCTLDDGFSNNTMNGNIDTTSFGTGFTNNLILGTIDNSTIGSTFTYNTIEASVSNCTFTAGFTRNKVRCDLTAVDFTGATHVYSSYTCDIIERSDAVQRLAYVNGTDTVVYDAITA